MEINKIFEMMTSQGKSGKDLAVYLNVTQQTVTNWKIGVSESYKKRLPEIAVFLNTTVEELAGIPLHAEKPDSLSEHEAQLIQAYRSNTKMQEAVDTLLGLSHETSMPAPGKITAHISLPKNTPSRPKISAYGLGSVHLDSKKELDDPEINRILKKYKKVKK